MASSNNVPAMRYAAGDWFGVIRRGTVVVLGPDTSPTLLDAVWDLLSSAPEAHEVLHEVTSAFGVSLSRIPPFGIIDAKDVLRVFLRGDLDLAVQNPAGDQELSGRDVTTWTERRLPGPDSYSLRIGPAATDDAPTGAGLPLHEGVVRLASLDVVLTQQEEETQTPVPPVVAAAPAQPHQPAPETRIHQPAPETQPDQPAPETRAASDETMIGYTDADADAAVHDDAAGHADADLGLTIVPGPVEPVDAVPESSAGQPDPEPKGSAGDASVQDAESAATSTTDPIVPSLETTTNYDHLWDKTVMRNIEDAAVRIDADADDHDVPVPGLPEPPAASPAQEPPGQEPPTQGPAGQEPAAREREAQDPDAQAAAAPPSGNAHAAASGPPPDATAASSVAAPALIDSVPWLRSSNAASVPAPEAPVVPPQVPPRDAIQPPAVDDFDHDGQTVMKSSITADAPAPAGQDPATALPGNGPSVLARVCSQGHANPPTYPQCAACGLGLSGDAVQVPRPRLGRMRLSTGELIDLDQSLIIGRQPSVSRVQGGTMPRLVQVESPGGDISRSHVEVRLEGWHVMLCDLKATNGTVLIREGQAPRRLAQNEMAILLDGDIAELGDDISLRFEEIL